MVEQDPAQTSVIEAVQPDSAADKAGLKAGDRILAIDGEAIAGFEDVTDRVLMHPGERIVITADRAGERLSVPVTSSIRFSTGKKLASATRNSSAGKSARKK